MEVLRRKGSKGNLMNGSSQKEPDQEFYKAYD